MKKIHPALPIFRLEMDDWSVLYTPGVAAVVEPLEADLAAEAWGQGRDYDQDPDAARTFHGLVDRARAVMRDWADQLARPFSPERLAVYPHNRCRMNCVYCFSGRGGKRAQGGGVIEPTTIRAAAELIAERNEPSGRPFRLALQGGGEPTLSWETLELIVDLTREAAARRGLDWTGYIAVNGVMSEKHAARLGELFDLICLSCDGPPDIQNASRPVIGGEPSARSVERSAEIWRKSGANFEVRATITPKTLTRQVEIAEYISDVLGPDGIRFEPVYPSRPGRSSGFDSKAAGPFAENLALARRAAGQKGIPLNYSGVRLDEIHGPYCDPARNVLRLTPEGWASPCFLQVDRDNPGRGLKPVGRLDPDRGLFALDHAALNHVRRRALRIPPECEPCVNRFHCSRGCPEDCLVHDRDRKTPSFRCELNRLAARDLILEAAAAKLQQNHRTPPDGSRYYSNPDPLWEKIRPTLPPEIDPGPIIDQWRILQERYGQGFREMPRPIWAERGFDVKGSRAWDFLKKEIGTGSNKGPLAVYLHVPFCRSRCGFCDCYAIDPGRRREELEENFTGSMLNEIRAWSEIFGLPDRPATTVHFGGGDPTSLSAGRFERILQALRDSLRFGPDTEWAIESSARPLTRDGLVRLGDLDFTRLHLGVQTLDPQIRKAIGRSLPPESLLERAAEAAGRGMTVSVDLIYGLPGQTPPGLIDDIRRLHLAGVEGFSLYSLNVSPRNEKFLKSFQNGFRDPLTDFVLLYCADRFLTGLGYRKNHFTHFARGNDKNLYYNHARRGEDLLALGPSADGVFGPHRYRQTGLGQYLKNKTRTGPSLQGTVTETDQEQTFRPLTVELMTARVRPKTMSGLGLGFLLHQWSDCGLLTADQGGGNDFRLSAAGTWAVSRMIEEAKALVETGN